VAEPYWVLVTGSRFYADYACVLATLEEIAAEHPGREMVLLHGMCDPRQPQTRFPVPWRAAERLSPEYQTRILGGDWLADRAALRLGWRIERRPADWERHGRKKAGFIRNDEMIAEMLANGALDGNGECAAFTGPCETPGCRITRPHDSHGTAHCLNSARKALIPVRPLPVAMPGPR